MDGYQNIWMNTNINDKMMTKKNICIDYINLIRKSYKSSSTGAKQICRQCIIKQGPSQSNKTSQFL